MPRIAKTAGDADVLTMLEVRLKRPKMYAVIMHNDDYTAMDFVVMVLCAVFKKSNGEAILIMQEVHNKGKCKVDMYPLDIALTKKAQTLKLAENAGFPLLVTIEEDM